MGNDSKDLYICHDICMRLEDECKMWKEIAMKTSSPVASMSTDGDSVQKRSGGGACVSEMRE